MCKGKEVCINGECQEGCKNDYDCKRGYKCYKNKCYITCDNRLQPGPFKSPTPFPCDSNKYCHPDHKVCLEKCSSNFDCEDGYKCHKGKCLQPCNKSKDPCLAPDQYCHE